MKPYPYAGAWPSTPPVGHIRTTTEPTTYTIRTMAAEGRWLIGRGGQSICYRRVEYPRVTELVDDDEGAFNTRNGLDPQRDAACRGTGTFPHANTRPHGATVSSDVYGRPMLYGENELQTHRACKNGHDRDANSAPVNDIYPNAQMEYPSHDCAASRVQSALTGLPFHERKKFVNPMTD